MLHRFPTRRRRREGPPEAAARRARRRGCETVRLHFPRYGPHRRRAVRDRAGQRDLGGADVDGRVPPVELPPRRRREARRVADRPRSRCRTAASDSVRRVAGVAHEVLDELGAVGWPKTSGGNGPAHLRADRARRGGSSDVRRAALAFAREVERRAPDDVTTTWWRKDRDPADAVRRLQPERPRPHDRQRLLGARACPEATVSTPITLGRGRRRRAPRLHDRDGPGALRRARRPARRHRRRRVLASTPLLEWADRDEREGAGDPGGESDA